MTIVGSNVSTGTGVRTEVIAPEPAEALAGLLGLPFPVDGAFVPPLWHWMYLLDRPPQSELGIDGHPVNGLPAPPGPGYQRMFAGGRVTNLAPLRFGIPATQTTRLTATAEKRGRSGPLTLVTVRKEIEQDGAVAIIDDRSIVYRPRGRALPPNDSASEASSRAVSLKEETRTLTFDVDNTVLFRFSALTYNAHRIHYDREYVKDEGYPDLVVHGPLQALLMGELLRRGGPPLRDHDFVYRLVAPVFGPQRLTVSAWIDGGGDSADVRDSSGRVSATAALRQNEHAAGNSAD